MDEIGSTQNNNVLPIEVWDSTTGEKQIRDLLSGKRLKITKEYSSGRIEGEWLE